MISSLAVLVAVLSRSLDSCHAFSLLATRLAGPASQTTKVQLANCRAVAQGKVSFGRSPPVVGHPPRHLVHLGPGKHNAA